MNSAFLATGPAERDLRRSYERATGSDAPHFALKFQYFSIPRVRWENEPKVSLFVDPGDVWAMTQLRMLLASALRRTQGPIPDQFRLYVGPVAGRLGRPVTTASAPVAAAVRRLRDRSGLPASDVAQMLGVRRRQLYKIVESGSTTSDREARLHAINDVVDNLYAEFGDSSTVRSCLLAPIGPDLRSFVDLAAEGDVRTAKEALDEYLKKRGDRPIPTYSERPRRSERRQQELAELARSTRDIVPEQAE